jgi:hypothetical protein
MKKFDVTCPECKASYRRVELVSKGGPSGEFRCLLCGQLLETFDGAVEIAFRLTVPPEKIITRFQTEVVAPYIGQPVVSDAKPVRLARPGAYSALERDRTACAEQPNETKVFRSVGLPNIEPLAYRRLVGSNVVQDRPTDYLKRGRKSRFAFKRDFRCRNSAYGLVLD